MEVKPTTDQHRRDYADVLRCYNAMETTKKRHFDYLSMLDDKQKRFNLAASDAETEVLALLLQSHDEEVQAFKRQSQLLKITNEAAHKALFEHIAFLHQVLAFSASSISH